MAVYVIFGMFFILTAIVNVGRRIDKKIIGFLFAFEIIMLWIIISFRACGYDYYSYQEWYAWMKNGNWVMGSAMIGSELGYAWLNNVALNYRMVIIVMATLTIGCYAVSIWKLSPMPLFSLFLLLSYTVYPGLMGQYRQALACSVFFVSLLFVYDRKIFSIVVLFGSLFHYTLFICLLVLFMPKKIMKSKGYISLLIVAFLCNLLTYNVFVNVSSLFPTVIQYKIDYYRISEEGLSVGLNMAMVLRVVIFILFYLNRNYISVYKYGSLIFNVYFFSLFFYLALGFLPQLSIRGTQAFYLAEIILAAMVVRNAIYYRWAYFLFFLVVGIYRQVSFFTSEQGMIDYIPYKYIFNLI